jgi:hypothetical protein
VERQHFAWLDAIFNDTLFGRHFALYLNYLPIIKHIMAKYSEKAGEKVEKTMHEMKEGKLKSGSGQKVTSKKQAIAIGLSEARKEGAKVPKKKA